ncbi:MAG: hypothetical protein QOG65_3780 [Actinomycetota bacterium]|jgi:hypothetical protein|nr:hypothetical protein [Actinomycetota bacterium]MDQ1386401.1 hypothetical protein [Actinomycetota bacterium]
MKWLSQFGRFWYDFIVGDDWTIAAAVVAVVAVTAAVAHSGHLAWPILPIGVAVVLSASVWRVLRSQRGASAPSAGHGPHADNGGSR